MEILLGLARFAVGLIWGRCLEVNFACNSFSMSFLLLKPAATAAFGLGASLQAELQKGLLMKIYYTENSEEPENN